MQGIAGIEDIADIADPSPLKPSIGCLMNARACIMTGLLSRWPLPCAGAACGLRQSTT